MNNLYEGRLRLPTSETDFALS